MLSIHHSLQEDEVKRVQILKSSISASSSKNDMEKSCNSIGSWDQCLGGKL